MLTDSMTVIGDDSGVHDIAGIMGGEHSGCSETTTDVLLEVAYFTPERIALTGQALGLTSDARSRFERGRRSRIPRRCDRDNHSDISSISVAARPDRNARGRAADRGEDDRL